MAAPTILWFRQDLRLHDQPALMAAAAEGPVVPLYVLDDEGPGAWAIGAAQKWWLHHSLASLAESLDRLGLRLILRRGAAAEAVEQVAAEVGARRVHAVRHHEPWWREAEAALAGRLDLRLHDGNQLVPPEAVRTGADKPYRVYGPWWRALEAHLPPPAPVGAPRHVAAPERWPESDRLEDWALLPTSPNWAGGFGEVWTPGETGARARLDAFLSRAADYADARDLPSTEGTARLSPHLHFGEISPSTVWHAFSGSAAAKFRKELAWRDFAQNMLVQFSDLGERNGRPAFDAFPWRTGDAAEADFRAWTRGRTGYPLVDAGMRELWATGWMHNRVRMVAASFLVKHLLLDWRRGARWFWDTLIDADYASNGLNWQWVAGTGVDSSPFGRIMAPLLQSEKFGAGDYIRRWVPELAHLPDVSIHDPEAAGGVPGYPPKIVGHREARARALEALASLRRA